MRDPPVDLARAGGGGRCCRFVSMESFFLQDKGQRTDLGIGAGVGNTHCADLHRPRPRCTCIRGERPGNSHIWAVQSYTSPSLSPKVRLEGKREKKRESGGPTFPTDVLSSELALVRNARCVGMLSVGVGLHMLSRTSRALSSVTKSESATPLENLSHRPRECCCTYLERGQQEERGGR